MARNYVREAEIAYQKNFKQIWGQGRIKRKVTKKDVERNPKLKGEAYYTQEPEYNTTEEAYKLLTEKYSALVYEREKYSFFRKYKVENQETIKAEIQEIEQWISEAQQLSVSNAFESYTLFPQGKSKVLDQYVYLRFKSGFYQHLEIEKYPIIASIGLRESEVYGRYFLLYEYLKNKLEKPNNIPLTASIIACFCVFANESKLIERRATESVKSYCRRVCSQYNLKYSDNVRQAFGKQQTSKQKNAVKTQIFPLIPDKDKATIENYLNSNSPGRQNLYT